MSASWYGKLPGSVQLVVLADVPTRAGSVDVMRVDEAETVELDRLEPPEPHSGGGVARGLAGSLAAGLVLLTLGLLAAELLTPSSGPGVAVLVGHAVAAVLAIVAAVVADRSRGFVTAAAVTAVLLVVAATLWVYWLA